MARKFLTDQCLSRRIKVFSDFAESMMISCAPATIGSHRSYLTFSSAFPNKSVVPFRGSRLQNFYHHQFLHPFAMSTAHSPDEPTGGIIEVPLAQTGEGIADCELLAWFVNEGDEIDEFQPLCSVQSDKATIQITSRYKGKVTRLNFFPGDIVKVGESLLELLSSTHVAPTVESLNIFPKHNIVEDTAGNSSGQFQATPAVRNLAQTYGVRLEDISGSGKDGRILKEDVINYVEAKEGLNEELAMISKILPTHNEFHKDHIEQEAPASPRPVKHDYTDRVIHVRGYQRAMVKTMTAAASIPHFYVVEELNLDALMKLKNNLKSASEGKGVKLTFLPLMIKALSVSLIKYPMLNSTFNNDTSEILLKGSHNVGVAVATNHGLAVPNIKNVQELSIEEIAMELSRLTHLAAINQLSQEDISGGTITVSNFGSIGGRIGFPLLNLPEVAIAAFGRVYKAPCFSDDGQIYPASLMNVSWAGDHRVLDGGTLVSFFNEWKTLIEQPERLLMFLK